MYDKARKRRGNSEYIIRVLTDQVSQILVRYMVFIRPFARLLDRRESEFLFADGSGPWAGEQLSRELAKDTNKHLGVRLPVSKWRHVAIGIAVQHLMHSSKVWEKDEGEDEEGDEFAEGGDEDELDANTMDHIIVRQSSHGQRVAQGHYAIDGGFLHRLGPQLIAAFEKASVAWHGLFGWTSKGTSQPKPKTNLEGIISDGTKGKQHGRQASQQLGPVVIKRERSQLRNEAIGMEKAIDGLRRIYGPGGKPQSEGQAGALKLVHNPPATSIVVLPTSSGKSVLFFSVAAMCVQQTVIVVVPFRTLVDDIVERGCRYGLSCKEWLGLDSCHEIEQLVIVSADRAVERDFLHWAKGIELNGQLAHMFFDEGHVAFTDRSYRAKLRDLWKLRYLDCPFTVLTATLMIQLEEKLREQLLIPDAILFRRVTARPRIQYKVVDSQDEMPSKVAMQMIQRIGPLPSGIKGVVYVRSYGTGEVISKGLECQFYKAKEEQKSELLGGWIEGDRGWIVATGALGTGINIHGIIYVVHIDRPYGLTSFAQQSGRGGRDGEVSQSIIVVRAKSTRTYKRNGIVSAYSTEQIDEDAMTEYIQSKGCRRVVLGKYFDGVHDGAECRQNDWVLCDFCSAQSHRERLSRSIESEEQWQGDEATQVELDGVVEAEEAVEKSGLQIIIATSREFEVSKERMFAVMEQLKEQCIYCMLIRGNSTGLSISMSRVMMHSYDDCFHAETQRCGMEEFRRWRKKIDLGRGQDCYKCGLSQQICRWTEGGGSCEYPDVVIPGMFVLHRSNQLQGAAEISGFQGSYDGDIWDWMREVDEGLRSERESNWTKTWRHICEAYSIMQTTKGR